MTKRKRKSSSEQQLRREAKSFLKASQDLMLASVQYAIAHKGGLSMVKSKMKKTMKQLEKLEKMTR
jgi:hypothetical protein